MIELPGLACQVGLYARASNEKTEATREFFTMCDPCGSANLSWAPLNCNLFVVETCTSRSNANELDEHCLCGRSVEKRHKRGKESEREYKRARA